MCVVCHSRVVSHHIDRITPAQALVSVEQPHFLLHCYPTIGLLQFDCADSANRGRVFMLLSASFMESTYAREFRFLVPREPTNQPKLFF